MKYKLSMKNENGKWWTYGNYEKNQWGNFQASFKVENLEKAIDIAKNNPNYKGYINFSAFEDNKDGNSSEKPSSSKPDYQEEELDDEIPPF